MVSVGAEDAVGFGVERFLHRAAGAEIVPHAAFDLEIKTEFVRGFKRGFGRTPRVKSHVVQTPVLARLNNFLPRFHIGRRIAGQRKIAAEMRATKTGLAAVDLKILTNGFEIAEAKMPPTPGI